jgi:hypothetical protein
MRCSAVRAYLLHLSPSRGGDPVARFHLDNGARLERINAVATCRPRACASPSA